MRRCSPRSKPWPPPPAAACAALHSSAHAIAGPCSCRPACWAMALLHSSGLGRALLLAALLQLLAPAAASAPSWQDWGSRAVYQARFWHGPGLLPPRPRMGWDHARACSSCLRPPVPARTLPPTPAPAPAQIVTDRFAAPALMPLVASNGKNATCSALNNYCGGTWQGILDQLDYIQARRPAHAVGRGALMAAGPAWGQGLSAAACCPPAPHAAAYAAGRILAGTHAEQRTVALAAFLHLAGPEPERHLGQPC